MKISELSTKSFLSGPNAQANSYVLINYEDTNTTGPVTYKATVEELGKAIANNLQLYKKTQAGATTLSVNNGAYVDETAKDFITLNTPKNIMVDPQGRTGYFTTTNSDSWVSLDTGVSEGYVAGVVSNLVSVNDLSNYTPEGGVSSGAVASIVNEILNENSYVKMGDSYLEYNVSTSAVVVKPSKIHGLSTMGVSEGYVTSAISGLASTGYVTAAVANAGGGGFDPANPIVCEFIPYGIDGSDPIEGNLYPVTTDGYALYRGAQGRNIINLVPLDKMLFYEIYEPDGGSKTLLLKDAGDMIIHSIPLN